MARKAYIDEAAMKAEFVLSKSKKKLTDPLVRCFMNLCDRLGSRPNFFGYSYLDDMKSDAYMQFLRTWHNFDPARGKVYTFMTLVAWQAFVGRINIEKKHTKLRDALVEDVLTYENKVDWRKAGDF